MLVYSISFLYCLDIICKGTLFIQRLWIALFVSSYRLHS